MTTDSPGIDGPSGSPAKVLRSFERGADRWHEQPSSAPEPSRAAHGHPDGTPAEPAGSDAVARWYVARAPGGVLDAADRLGLPTADIRARLHQIQAGAARVASRVVRVNDHAVYIVVPTASFADEQVSTGSIALIVTPDCVVTAEEIGRAHV